MVWSGVALAVRSGCSPQLWHGMRDLLPRPCMHARPQDLAANSLNGALHYCCMHAACGKQALIPQIATLVAITPPRPNPHVCWPAVARPGSARSTVCSTPSLMSSTSPKSTCGYSDACSDARRLSELLHQTCVQFLVRHGHHGARWDSFRAPFRDRAQTAGLLCVLP